MKDPKALGDATPNAAETRKKRETKISTDISAIAIAASPQPMSLADILHGLIAAYSPDTRAGNQTIAPAEKKKFEPNPALLMLLPMHRRYRQLPSTRKLPLHSRCPALPVLALAKPNPMPLLR